MSAAARDLLRRLREDAAYQAVVDRGGRPLVRGSRIVAEDGWPGGVVVGVSDVEGDVDEDGRSVTCTPRVRVLLDDGGEEVFGTFWMGSPAHPESDEVPVFMAEDVSRV